MNSFQLLKFGLLNLQQEGYACTILAKLLHLNYKVCCERGCVYCMVVSNGYECISK